MRLTTLTILILSTICFSGCSSRRAYMPGGSPVTGNTSAYDADPPRPSQGSDRLAIQPRPVPPATGISHIRGISFTQTAARCGEDGCGDNICVTEGCDTRCRRRGCLPEICNFYDQKYHAVRRHIHEHTAPKCGDDGCGDLRPRYSRHSRLCPCPDAVCVPPSHCGEAWHQPLIAGGCGERGGCCEEGCNSGMARRQGLLPCLMDSLQACVERRTSRCGDYCPPSQYGCGEQRYGYGNACGEGCGLGCGEHSPSASDCRPSPLAGPMSDPFLDSKYDQEPTEISDDSIDFRPAAPAVPEITEPRTLAPAEDALPLPAPVAPDDTPTETETAPAPEEAEADSTAYYHVSPQVDPQKVVQPQMWPRLKSSDVAVRPRAVTTHPTGWVQ